MNKIVYGHTPNVNGLLNLDRSDTHIHNIDSKRCKVDNDTATYLWHCRLGHIGVKCRKYALEAIIKWLLLYFLVHDNCLLFML